MGKERKKKKTHFKLHSLHGFPRHSLTHYPYYPLPPAGPLVYILCPYRAVVGMFFLVIQHWHVHVTRVHMRTSLMISFLFLQQCLVCLIWMILEIGDRQPYNCFEGCCFQDLFNTACNILLYVSHYIFQNIRRTEILQKTAKMFEINSCAKNILGKFHRIQYLLELQYFELVQWPVGRSH